MAMSAPRVRPSRRCPWCRGFIYRHAVIRRIMKHDASNYVAQSRIFERGPYPAQEISCRIAIVVGESQDFAASDCHSGIVRVPKSRLGLEHVMHRNRRRVDKLPDNGCGLIRGSVIHSDQLPGSLERNRLNGLDAVDELKAATTSGDDQRDTGVYSTLIERVGPRRILEIGTRVFPGRSGSSAGTL
jgi:hypothetical protein